MLKTYDFKGIKIDESSEINDLSIKHFSSEDLGITGLRANFGLFDEMGAKPLIEVDGLLFLKNLGKGAFCIDPRRWHRIKTYIAQGNVTYPEGLNDEFGVFDGRHRTLLLMQLYKRRFVPVVVDEKQSKEFIAAAKQLKALKF
ncbi:hypothetical protein O1614_19175 [Proteus mirabilis]|uniref:hypothetical protein n=1 Tax=Proteus mirabilis TaxID=584 RepID=UPI0022B577CD|nr:hypothetical protein [Proteus mirabilis]MCZ4672637.1 hypothetical protein [Proteus mirabilis]